MTRVCCVGLTTRDLIYSVERLPSGPGKTFASDRTEVGGGPAANAAVAIARLGGEASLVTALGDDQLGDELTAELGRLGVETSGVHRVSGARSSLSVAVVDPEGERTIVNHTDRRAFTETTIAEHELANADAVLGDSHWPAGAARALAWARLHDKPGLLDFDAGADRDLLKHPSHCVFAADALRGLVDEHDLSIALQAAADLTDAWVAVTAGAHGVYWVEDREVRHLPAFDVDVVDTVGAGDVFHGALALLLGASELGLYESLRFASAAASLTCRSFGGRTGIPTRREVDAFLEGALA